MAHFLSGTKKFLSLLLILCFPVLLFAEASVDLGDGLTLTRKQIQEIERLLPKSQEDKIYYRWTSREVGIRQAIQGKLSLEDVAHYNTPSLSDNQMYGPGVYLADTPQGSIKYGDFPLAFKIKQGTPLYDPKIVMQVTGIRLSHEQACKLGKEIPFVRDLGNRSWFITNHTRNTANVTYGLTASPEARIKGLDSARKWDIFSLMEDLGKVNHGDPEFIRLKKMIALSDYLDGVSYARALQIDPDKPWSEVGHDRLEIHERALESFSLEKFKVEKGKSWNIEETKEVLAQIHAKLNGRDGPSTLGPEMGQKVDELLNRYRGVSIDMSDSRNISFLNELLSLKPFGEGSELAVKTYFKLGFLQVRKPVPFFMLPKLEDSKELLQAAQQTQLELQRAILDEYLLAKAQGRSPDYLKKVDWQSFLSKGLPGIGSIDLKDPIQQELIKKHEWNELFGHVAEKEFDVFGKQLKEGSRREEVLSKIGSFKLDKFANYSEKTKEKIGSLLLSELQGKGELGAELALLYKKYAQVQPFLKVNFPGPETIKLELLSRIDLNLKGSTQKDSAKAGASKALRVLVEDDVTFTEELFKYSFKGMEKGTFEKVMQDFDEVLKRWQQNKDKQQLKILAQKALPSFLEVGDAGRSLNILKSLASLPPEELANLGIKREQIKQHLLQFVKSTSEEVRMGALEVFPRFSDSPDALLELIVSGELLTDKNHSIQRAAQRHFDQLLKALLELPQEEVIRALVRDKHLIFPGLAKSIQYQISKKGTSQAFAQLEQFELLFNKLPEGEQAFSIKPVSIKAQIRRGLEVMAKDSYYTSQLELFKQYGKLTTESHELMPFLELVLTQPNPVARAHFHKTFENVMGNWAKEPQKMKGLKSQEQKELLNSLKRISEFSKENRDFDDFVHRLSLGLINEAEASNFKAPTAAGCTLGSGASCNCVYNVLSTLLK